MRKIINLLAINIHAKFDCVSSESCLFRVMACWLIIYTIHVAVIERL